MSNSAAETRVTFQNLMGLLDRFSLPIVVIVAGLYLAGFPVHKSPMFVVIPVVTAGWLYGVRGGWISSLAALALDIYLYDAYVGELTFRALLTNNPGNFILAGHAFVLVAGVGIGKLRKLAENRERMEAALRASEEQYRAIVDNQTELICRAQPDGTVIFANPSYLKFFGKPLEDVLGKKLLEREEPGKQYEMVKASMARLGVEAPILTFVECFPRRDGEKRWVQWVNHAIIKNGKVVEIQLTGRDITDHKRAEDDLLEREVRLATIFDNSADAIITISEEQKILSFSKSAEAVFGYSAAEVIGCPLELLMPARFEDTHRDHVRDFATSAVQSRKKGARRQIFGKRKNGEEFPAEASISKINFSDKNEFAIFLRDIGERLRKEKELRSQARFMSQLNDLTRAMIASTDFNSAMEMAVDSFAKLLEADSCYITRWDSFQERAFPLAATDHLKEFFLKMEYPIGEKNLTTSVLEEKRIIIAENKPETSYTTPDMIGRFPEKVFICIPLIYGSHKLGGVFAGYNEWREFAQEELQRAEQAGNQIALSLWNMQQDMELQRSLREEKTLSEIALALSETESISLSNVLSLIVNSARYLIRNTEQSVIHLYDKKEQTLVSEAVSGFTDPTGGKRSIKLGEGIAGQVVTSGETINITDVNTDPRFVKLGVEPTYRSLMVAPVRTGKQALGTISVQSGKPYAFTPNDNNLLSQLGTQAAIAIENANLLEKIQQSLKETNALYRINRGLVASLDPDGLMQDTVELLQKNFGYYYVQVFVADPDTGNFVMRAGSGELGAQLKARNYQLAPGEGIVGYTAETGEAFFTNDVRDAVWFIPHPLLPDTKSEMAVPVKIGEDILGVLDVQQAPPGSLSERDKQMVSAIADQLAVALQRAALHEHLQISLQQEKAIRNQMMQNERLTVMGRLLATVSHELNNPLQAIQNALFLLKEETDISEQGRQDLEIVLAESERMGNLIERLRATYRPTQSEELRPTQLNRIVEDVHALISTHLRHNNITFDFQPDPELPAIPALSDQIRQVTLNLLMNACEAMQGGGKLSVSTKLMTDSNEIMLAVSDTGSGIPANLMPIIFEAFITNKSSGTGLGLTISHDIVLKHRGRISAENNPDECGATFIVWLPINNGELA